MAVLLLGLLILAMAGHSSAAYCVCKQGLSDAVLQSAIDYACGAGADCRPINPNGQCYNPNTVLSHCSYAVNNYYQKKAASGATCDFNGAATLSSSAPSGGCSAGSGSTGTGASGPITTVPTTSPTTGSTPTTPTTGTNPLTPVPGAGTGVGVTPTGASPTTTSPYGGTGTPSSGAFGGVGTGLGPTASSMDDNGSGIKLDGTSFGWSVLVAFVISGIICWWN